MIRKSEEVASKLTELYERLLKQPILPKEGKWKDDWREWEREVGWHPDSNGVYILWENDRGIANNKPPVYVGEGILGPRIWKSFYSREWSHAQMIVDELISGNSRECRFWRKALERFCIVALDPQDNKD